MTAAADVDAEAAELAAELIASRASAPPFGADDRPLFGATFVRASLAARDDPQLLYALIAALTNRAAALAAVAAATYRQPHVTALTVLQQLALTEAG